MRRALAAAALLVAVGCKQKEEAPPAPTFDWVQQSADGRFELRQRREGSGCRVQAVVRPGDRPLWSAHTCLPTSSGVVFLSPDGERLLALDLFPAGPGAQVADWTSLPLVSVWSQGAVIRQYTGGELLSAERVTQMQKVLSWVKGDTFDDARRAARASADGAQVTVGLVDGRTVALDFEGGPLPAPPAAAPAVPARAEVELPAPGARRDRAVEDVTPPTAEPVKVDPMALDEQGLYSWEDEHGELHFGAGAQIPARFRKRATPVSATVGVVPVESSAPAGKQQQGQPQAPASGGTAGQPRPPAGQPAGQPAAPPGTVQNVVQPGVQAPAPADEPR